MCLQALRAAYSDFGNKPLQVVGPPFSNPNYAGTFGQVTCDRDVATWPDRCSVSQQNQNLPWQMARASQQPEPDNKLAARGERRTWNTNENPV